MDSRFPSNFARELRENIDRAMAGINTCLPGIIESFDPTTQTVTVKPAVKMRTMIDEKEEFIELPTLINVPLQFPYDSVSGFAVTFPVSKGSNCMIVFTQRSFEAWWQKGGVQPPEEGVCARHHDLSDAFVIMSPATKPAALATWNNTGIELRNRDRSVRVTVSSTELSMILSSGVSISLTSTGIAIAGHLTVDGNFDTTGWIKGTPGVDLVHHWHNPATLDPINPTT